MAQTHFERVVEEEKGKLLKSLVSISAAESHRIADVQGQYKGLETALKLYREAARIDIEADI